MPQNNSSLQEIRQSYIHELNKFNNFRKSFNKNMRLVLSEDADNIELSLNNFNALLLEWDTNSDLRSIGKEKFLETLNKKLDEIIASHTDLVTRAKSITTSYDPSLEELGKLYKEAVDRFNKFRQSFDKNMTLVLSDDAEMIAESFQNLNELLLKWDTNDDIRSVGKENFVAMLNQKLIKVIEAHDNLTIRAKSMTKPSYIENIKSYLSAAVACITKMLAAVTKFAINLQQKATTSISTRFNKFKESVKKIEKTSITTTKKNPNPT